MDDIVQNRVTIQQLFTAKITVFGNLGISQDIFYVRMTDNNKFLTMYVYRDNYYTFEMLI